MNPVHAPHYVGGGMQRGRLGPVVVDVVAQLFKNLGHEVRSRRLVLASFDFDSAGSKHSGEGTDSFQGASMETQDGGWAKLEWALRLQRIVDALNDFVELPEAVLRFLARFFFRIGDELDLQSFTVTLLVRHVLR